MSGVAVQLIYPIGSNPVQDSWVVLEDRDVGDLLFPPVAGVGEARYQPFSPIDENHLQIVISTRVAYCFDFVSAMARAIFARGWLEEDRRNDLILALREAVANALFHGNMELVSDQEGTVEGFLEHAKRIEERLASNDFGLRPLVLTATRYGSADQQGDSAVELVVQDAGGGFTPTRPKTAIDPHQKSGRGISLMLAHADGVCFEDGGRRTVLTFVCPERHHG